MADSATIRALYSILFWAFLCASCAALFFVALAIFLVTWPFDPNGRVLHLFSCFWAQLYLYVNPMWRLRVEGRRKLPWLERGVPVMIFPEGSRLAISKGCPVIPIAISGTARTLPKHGFVIKERVNCRVRVRDVPALQVDLDDTFPDPHAVDERATVAGSGVQPRAEHGRAGTPAPVQRRSSPSV